MGRYYEGDIDGKFWFAIQDSNDGEFFGAEEQESNWIDYYLHKEEFEESDGIKSYTDSLDSEFHTIYVWLARLDMGRKMQKFFKQNPEEDYLTFQAEC